MTPAAEVVATLTPRQKDVALLAARGDGTTAIATALGMSYDAAKAHVNAISDKLNLDDDRGPLERVRRWAIEHRALLLP